MIAENPIENSGEFILHSSFPRMLIKVFNLTDKSYEEREKFVEHIPVGGSCEVLGDYYYFVPCVIYDSLNNIDTQKLNVDLSILFKQVGDWFSNYVLWEEENCLK